MRGVKNEITYQKLLNTLLLSNEIVEVGALLVSSASRPWLLW